MEYFVYDTKEELGKEAAKKGASFIHQAIKEKGSATIIVATGASQFEMIEALVDADIDWSKVEGFHLDEYLGMSITHGASFRKYLKERFVDKVKNMKAFHYIEGDSKDIEGELKRLNDLISSKNVDVAFVGVGENGHLAFNDPPADFEITDPYIIVDLDEACRKQQMGEGWFPTLQDVPLQAISMSIKQILKSEHIINTVPDERKANAIKCAMEGKVSNLCPASILQTHPSCYWYLDIQSASKLKK
jgi:glucosamine-6-phosphate deaminase